MKLTLKELYDLAKETNLAVLGKDGLPLNWVVVSDKYYFCYNSKSCQEFDFIEFYEKCVPTICQSDLVGNEVDIYLNKEEFIHWIGLEILCYSEKCDMFKPQETIK